METTKRMMEREMAEKMFEEIMTKHFTDLMKNINLRIQESQ